MRGIRISSPGKSHLSFDLRDILAAVGSPVADSTWHCRDLDFTVKNEAADDYQKPPRKVSGAEFLRFADVVLQVIDGRFDAYTPGAAKRPWLSIEAIDSSYWEVWSTKDQVIEGLRARFTDATELSPADR